MTHQPANRPLAPEPLSAVRRRGFMFFRIYFLLYAAFLLIHLIAPEVMSRTSLASAEDSAVSLGRPNFAILTGVALILAGAILVLIVTRKTTAEDP